MNHELNRQVKLELNYHINQLATCLHIQVQLCFYSFVSGAGTVELETSDNKHAKPYPGAK